MIGVIRSIPGKENDGQNRMTSSQYIVSNLLALDQRKGTPDEKRVRAFPVILGLLNLFFCSYMDHYLQQDVDGHYLALLLFLESSLMTMIAVGAFLKSGSEV